MIYLRKKKAELVVRATFLPEVCVFSVGPDTLHGSEIDHNKVQNHLLL